MNSVMMPATEFTADTHGFSQGFSHPEVALLLAYNVFDIVCIFTGPAWFDWSNHFHLYAIPFQFMWRGWFIGLAYLACYLLLSQMVRRCSARYG